MIDPQRALETISKHRTNEVVVTTMSSSRGWPEFSQRPDLDLALRGIAFSAMGTAGQRCTTLRRLFLHDSLWDGFRPRLRSAFSSIETAVR